jgi:uncharacterized protein
VSGPLPRQAPAIDGLGGGGFRIAGVRHEGSVLILDDQVRPWNARSLAELGPEHFAQVLSERGAAEFVLLGTGASQGLPPRSVREALQAARIGLEFMDTGAACKLYNYLASEGRRIAAALIAV